MTNKEEIIKTLGDESWNGTAKNETPYTQWKATEEFFQLWKEKKDEIKAARFSLYKHDKLGWIVTLFEVHEGTYKSYNEYLLIQKKRELVDMTDDEKILNEIDECKNLKDLIILEDHYKR